MARGQRAPSPSLRGFGEHCKLPQQGPGQNHGKCGFWSILGPQKSRQNGQLASAEGGGGGDKSSPQRRTAPGWSRKSIPAHRHHACRHALRQAFNGCTVIRRPNKRAKLHYTDIGYGHVVQHHQRTPPTDELTTILYHKFATSQCQSPTSRHVKILGCVKFLSVGWCTHLLSNKL